MSLLFLQLVVAMIWLCARDELEYAADKDYVIKFNDAWNRYVVLA